MSAILPLDGAASPCWPFRWELELTARPSAVTLARKQARLMLTGWGLSTLADPVEQVVAELVANAISASDWTMDSDSAGAGPAATPTIRLWLVCDRQRVLIQVWDRADAMPIRQDPDLDAESGRGLLLIEALCEHWGAYRSRDAWGKVVWGVVS